MLHLFNSSAANRAALTRSTSDVSGRVCLPAAFRPGRGGPL